MAGISAEQMEELLTTLRNQGSGGSKLREIRTDSAAEYRAFKAHFLISKSMTEWDDIAAKRHFLRCFSDQAYSIVSDLRPDLEGQTFQQLLTEVDSRFLGWQATNAAKAEFRSARQLPTENIVQFHGRLRDLFQTAFPEIAGENLDTNQDLIQRFGLALADRRISDHVRDGQPVRYSEALKRATRKFAEMNERSSWERAHSSSKPFLNSIGGNPASSSSMGNFQANRVRSYQPDAPCDYCGRSNHSQPKCFAYLNASRKLKQELQFKNRRGSFNNRGRASFNTPFNRGRGRPRGRGSFNNTRYNDSGNFRVSHLQPETTDSNQAPSTSKMSAQNDTDVVDWYFQNNDTNPGNDCGRT